MIFSAVPLSRFRGMLLTVCVLLGACGTSSMEASERSINSLSQKISSAGLGCDQVEVVESPDSDPATFLGVDVDLPRAEAVGTCVLRDAPMFQGLPMATQILAFEGEDHLEHLPPADVLGGYALVYGPTWEVLVIPSDHDSRCGSGSRCKRNALRIAKL